VHALSGSEEVLGRESHFVSRRGDRQSCMHFDYETDAKPCREGRRDERHTRAVTIVGESETHK